MIVQDFHLCTLQSVAVWPILPKGAEAPVKACVPQNIVDVLNVVTWLNDAVVKL